MDQLSDIQRGGIGFNIFSTRFECIFFIFSIRLECSFDIFSTRFECSKFSKGDFSRVCPLPANFKFNKTECNFKFVRFERRQVDQPGGFAQTDNFDTVRRILKKIQKKTNFTLETFKKFGVEVQQFKKRSVFQPFTFILNWNFFY